MNQGVVKNENRKRKPYTVLKGLLYLIIKKTFTEAIETLQLNQIGSPRRIETQTSRSHFENIWNC